MRFFPRLIVALALIVQASLAGAAGVRAWLDRETMQMGETVTLNVESEDGGEQPDFAPLAKDFQLLGTTGSSSVNIINGASTSKQLWAIGLSPKHEGRIEIPEFGVGAARTQPLTLTVQPAPQGASGNAGDDVFIEVGVEPTAAFVQEQMRYTVKLYLAVNLLDGNMEEPQADGLQAQKLGQDKSYQAERGGRRYQVIERHYALGAQKSGRIVLPALNFRGHAPAGNSPGGFFINRGRAIAARSEAIELDIKPRPANAPPGPWIPAASLDFGAEGIDATTHAKVGEPLTLSLHLRAQGLGFEQLPELELPKIDGAEVYPDKAETRTRDDGIWLYGERSRKFAIVPTRAGTLHLPAQTVHWWDTQHGVPAQAELPAIDVEVAPAAGGKAAPPPESAASSPAAPAAAPTPSLSIPEQSNFWRNVALATGVLWFATLALGFLAWRRRAVRPVSAAPAEPAPETKPRKAFRDACRRADAGRAARALLDWAIAEGIAARNLGDVAAALGDPAQRDALAAFERARFGSGDAAAALPTLASAFERGFVRASNAGSTDEAASVLPPLYPPARRGA